MDMTHAKDQAFYDAAQIEEHLLCLWEEEYALRAKPEQEIRAKGDPAISPALPIVVADIRQAWDKADLELLEKQVVTCRGFWGMPLVAIAEHFQLGEDEAAALYDNAIAKMIDFLGGTRG